jgi:DNA-directed RNA polymerase subunit alpha
MTTQQNWQQLIRPTKLQVSTGTDSQRMATLVAEPLERGFGRTLGNALRRILLSSLQGAAVQSVHIDGVLHEYSSIAGVREDVTDILLNIKDIALKMRGDGPTRMVVKKRGPGTVTAADIQTLGDVVVLNPELVLCTLDAGAEIRMEFTVATGKGYVPAERKRLEDAPIGLIPVDSLYSPVRKVSYKVENTREGQILDYDKLTISIETNGAISPEDALAYAARILQDQLNVFVNFEEPEREIAHEAIPDLAFNPAFLIRVDELELSVRSANSLMNAGIIYIGDLVQKTDAELLHAPNFGRKSLNEIKEVLVQMSLHLGMDVPGWPPQQLTREVIQPIHEAALHEGSISRGDLGLRVHVPAHVRTIANPTSAPRNEEDSVSEAEEFMFSEAMSVLKSAKKSCSALASSLVKFNTVLEGFQNWARETRGRISSHVQ